MKSEILKILRGAGSDYISGEDIASKLGVSRTAVWKHIKDLRKSGYDIVSRVKSGYMLKETPDLLLPAEVKNGLNTKEFGKEIVYFTEIESTNEEAKTLAANGAVEGTVVVAEEQGAGKGRLQRKFYSPFGKGIWFSIILRPKILPQDAPKCTLLAAVAVAKAMDRFKLRAQIKWPNDILYDNKKLVGILTEMATQMDGIEYVVIGTGINVNIWPQDFPDEIRDVATSLAIMNGGELSRVDFFRAVLEEMENLYQDVSISGFTNLMNEWKKYSITLGQDVRVISAGDNKEFYGKAIDIDEDGALLVETSGGIKKVLAGDVSIRKKNDVEEIACY